ncbi:hypothetical protein EJ07DRAFT_168659 [Lizonia empirigonia]|nr:hypothetical protein EJ07DRAFT_168659 [Lizonia empirigonia]
MPFINSKGASTLGHTFRNFDQTIITVQVGPKDYQEPFSCHKELLRRCSAHFDQCLSEEKASPYKSSGTSLELEDVSPDVFDAFMMWLYTGFIPHHLIEGGKEIHPPTHAINTNGSNCISADQHESEDVDTTSWGISLDNDDIASQTSNGKEPSISEAASADKVSGETSDAEKPTPSPPVRNPAEKPEIPKETLCPCCSRPYKWRGLEGFLERRFIALYVFAHRYSIPALRRSVLVAWQTNDEILQSMPDHSNDNDFAIPLRSQLPQAFLFELVTMLARGERPKTEKEWCEFHEHENEEERKTCCERLGKDPVAGKALRRIRDSKGWKGLVLKKGKR